MRSDVLTRFQDALLRYSQEPDSERRAAIENELWQEYGRERAVLVLDMSGFSQLTARFGVVHYLSMVRRMQITAEPIIRSFAGIVVKFEADNCFAMFEAPLNAVRCAIALNLAFDAANVLTPEALDIKVACGIDFGPILVIDDSDFFGDTVNRACKLGEDLAASGEILVTSSAMQGIPSDAPLKSQPVTLTISGIAIEACSVQFDRDAMTA